MSLQIYEELEYEEKLASGELDRYHWENEAKGFYLDPDVCEKCGKFKQKCSCSRQETENQGGWNFDYSKK